MSVRRRLLNSVGNDSHYARAVYFDGSNDALSKASELSGLSDGKVGTFSAWIKFDATGDSEFNTIVENGFSSKFRIRREDGGEFRITGGTSAGGLGSTLLLQTTNDITSADGWVHILASWDLANTTGHLYVSDVDDLGSNTLVNATLDYTKAEWWAGSNDPDATSAFAYPFTGDIADLYLNLTEYVDISVEANRRKFINDDGKPVFLGADGSLPTGSAPIMFLSLADSAVVSTFATNKGTGGDFTITGTLTESSTSPSD